jgi:hypothetical protein
MPVSMASNHRTIRREALKGIEIPMSFLFHCKSNQSLRTKKNTSNFFYSKVRGEH